MTTNNQEYDDEDDNDVSVQANHHALHIEEEENETDEEYRQAMRQRLRHDPAVVRRKVLRRYYLLSTIAVTFTLTCPQTFLWNDNGTLVRPFFVARLLIVYLGTLAFLTFCLQGSNPGYLTPTVMQQLDDWETQQEQQKGGRKFSEPTSSSSSTEDAEKKGDEGTTDPESQASLPTEADCTTAAHDRLALLENNNDDAALLRPTRRPPCRHCPRTMPPPPLRSHHCHKCGYHVATFDHHCDFAGVCVGERNHARFWIFLTLQLYGFAMCATAVTSSPRGILDYLLGHGGATHWTTLVYIIVGRMYLYPLVAAATLMWIFHTFLACTNSTTMEFAKGARHLEYLHPQTRMCDLPFSDRLDRNLSRWIRRDAGLSGTSALWRPTLWQRPGKINHETEEWWQNPWQNKYWSCC